MMNKTLAVLFSMFAAVACGDDDAQPNVQTQPEPDTDIVETDAGMDTDVPDVAPPAPVPRFITLEMTPSRIVYATGVRLLPEVAVLGVDGTAMTEAAVDVTVAPGDAAERVNDRWELKKEGLVTFTACALDPGPDGNAVCASDTVMVDDGPPVLTITAPTPGLQTNEMSATVSVTGTVTDSHGEPLVFVNGHAVDVVDGTFETVASLDFGVNHIEVVATDQVNPTSALAAVDVMWAPIWDPVDPQKPGVVLDDAIVFWLGQAFVDDRLPLARRSDGSYLTQDLVDILELVLRHVDLMSQISNPVVDGSGVYLAVDDINIGKPRIVGNIVDGGIELYLQLNDLLVTTQGGLDINGQILNLSGSIEATMSALIRLDVSKPNPNDPIVVSVSEVRLAVEGASANFASPEANAIFQLAQSILRSTLETMLLDVVQDAFVAQLPALLTDTLGALDTALRDQSIDLDLGLGNPLTLLLDARISRIETSRRQALQAFLSGSATLDTDRLHTDSLGIPSLGTADDPFFESSRIQVGLKQTFINGLLHGLWDAGLLELDVTEQLPITADNARISAKLQPVLRPPLEGQDATVVLQVGQLELTVEVLGRTDRYGVNIESGVAFDLVAGQLAVAIDEVPRLETWVIESSAGAPLLSAEGLEMLLLSRVYPELLTALSGGLSITLPAPDLSGLGSVAAPLSAFQVSFGLARPVTLRDGWVVVDATLDGTL